jgi:hypothetical protein
MSSNKKVITSFLAYESDIPTPELKSSEGSNSELKIKPPSKKPKTEKNPKTISEPQKLKILCIHGYRQNEKMFREKTGAFRKLIGKHADLVFITAPHEVQPINSEESNEVGKMRIASFDRITHTIIKHLPLVFYNI